MGNSANSGTKPARGRAQAALLLAALPALAGCVNLALGAAGQVGVEAVRERGLSGAADDAGTRLSITRRWIERGIYADNLYLQIWEGRVLVSGAVDSAVTRAEAIQSVWEVEGVREVINEVDIVPRYGVSGYVRDVSIVNTINGRLLLARDIASVNYSVDSVRGKVFLLGVAQSEAERQRVLAIVRAAPGVRRVADYVLLRDDPRRFAPPLR